MSGARYRREASRASVFEMIGASVSDPRVILIRIAEQLHTMRMSGALPKLEQQREAEATLDVFAPLAHRLGVHAIGRELEDLSFAVLSPRAYSEVERLVDEEHTDREGDLEHAIGCLRATLDAAAIEAEISGHSKHLYAIYAAMQGGRESMRSTT